ncbi:MAG: hypothetical protein ABEJ69_00285 [Candidatus Nanohaloarchaea archaeon]
MDEFEKIRVEALEEASEKGVDILDDSATATAFAADTSEYGQSVREDLYGVASNPVQEESSRFVDYEVTEKARIAGMYVLDDGDLAARLVTGENQLEKLYRAFTLVDRLQRGYTDKRPETPFDGEDVEPQRYPDPLDPDSMARDQAAALEESGSTGPENLGSLNQFGVAVLNDDWLSYRSGRQPETVDEEVFEYLEELGVAR